MNKERCLKWNVKCEYAEVTGQGMDCPLDNTVFCNTQVLKARHEVIKRRKYRIDKFDKGGITGGKVNT